MASTFLIAAIVVVVWSLAQNATFVAAQVEMGGLHPANPATAFALCAALVQAGGAVGTAVSAGVLATPRSPMDCAARRRREHGRDGRDQGPGTSSAPPDAVGGIPR